LTRAISFLSYIHTPNLKRVNRRNFLQLSGLSTLPVVTGAFPIAAAAGSLSKPQPQVAAKTSAGSKPATTAGDARDTSTDADPTIVWFTRDGPRLAPDQYITLLGEINKTSPIKGDAYGEGGTVADLLAKFLELTGKEAAIYMPSGTLANQLAIAVLSGANDKVFVQETSHVFRDEADAAQSVYGKRLMPLAKGSYAFTLQDLQQEIGYVGKEEYFKTGIGAVSIEIPVRRCNAQVFPIDELKKVSDWCRQKGYKLHLDGARLHLASAWSGVPVKEYASLFDTVYMCLYKYLGASSGAVLCGSKEHIAPMEHLVKVHGGAMYQNWSNASIALYHLQGLEARLTAAKETWEKMMTPLTAIGAFQIQPIPNGCNIFHIKMNPGYDGKKLAEALSGEHAIRLPTPDDVDGAIHLHVNETILQRDQNAIITAFTAAAKAAKTDKAAKA
jgi:threonine aldolase